MEEEDNTPDSVSKYRALPDNTPIVMTKGVLSSILLRLVELEEESNNHCALIRDVLTRQEADQLNRETEFYLQNLGDTSEPKEEN